MSNVTCNPFVYFWLNKVSIRNHECMRATNHVLNDYIPAFPRLREELLLLDEDAEAASRVGAGHGGVRGAAAGAEAEQELGAGHRHRDNLRHRHSAREPHVDI